MSRFTKRLGFVLCPNCCDRCQILECRQLLDPEYWEDELQTEDAAYDSAAFPDDFNPKLAEALALARRNS